MRVTDRLRYMTMMQSLDRKAQDLQLRNEIAVTGRKINRPSQGAAGYATALTNTARMEQLEGRAEAIQRSRGDLSLAESSLAGAGDILKRARELASLRVFGFPRGEVSGVLISELGVMVLLAQPLGWLLGYLFSWSVVKGFESDLFRVPFVINTATFAFSSLVVVGVAAISALIVRRRIDHLDLVSVLKTRE